MSWPEGRFLCSASGQKDNRLPCFLVKITEWKAKYINKITSICVSTFSVWVKCVYAFSQKLFTWQKLSTLMITQFLTLTRKWHTTNCKLYWQISLVRFISFVGLQNIKIDTNFSINYYFIELNIHRNNTKGGILHNMNNIIFLKYVHQENGYKKLYNILNI